MRKLGAALLAVPVLVAAYLAVGARGSIAGRLAAITGAIVVVAIVAAVSLPPTPSTATPPSVARQPVAADFSAGIHTGHGLRAPFTVHFSAAMDAASVAVAFRLEPEAAYSLDWDASGTTLSVAPVGHWAPDTLYSLVVGPAARSVDGARLPNAVRAVFLTAPAGSAAIAATRTFRGEARVDTAFRITLDRPVSLAILQAAIHTTPAIQGTVRANDVAGQYLYTPDEPLPASTALEVSLEGLVDADGVPFAPVAPLAVTTAGAPTVVRIRPFAGSTGNARDAAVSVRFTEAMSHAGTATAFHVLVNGAEAKGATRWAEGDTVLVFEPARQFPYAATVTVRVDASATSRAGVALARAKTGVFKVEKKPVPRTQPATKIPRGSGGGGAVSGSWTGVEKYYLRLMNCTRTGGWVTSSGSCSSPGGRDVAPLRLDSGISTHVSRPYAKLLATRGLCDHFVGGNPGDRLRRAGYTSYRWAENLGCRSGNPYSAVLGSHLYFQSERSYSGGHYVNLMNAAYDRCGIGVWVSGGRVRLVVDFYHP